MFVDKYKDDILGTNGCFDRVVVSGSFVPISYVKGLSGFLSANKILLKEFLPYAKYLAELLKAHAQSLADQADVPYIYLNDSKTRKETLIKSIIQERGKHPGLVAVLAALEVCPSFDIFKNKERYKLELVQRQWHLSYHWSIRQIEYAYDILFESEDKLDAIYKQLLQYMTLSTMPEDIMSFLGKKLSGPQAGRIDTSMKKTYLGYRIKHRNGAISIKVYNKAGSVLRIEITINDLSQFRVHRAVTGRDGQSVTKLAPLKKSIYSLEHILRISKAAIERYLDFLSHMQDNSYNVKELRHLTERKTVDGNNYKGFNPLNREDSILFEILLNGSFITTGFKNKELKLKLSEGLSDKNWSTSKVSRLLKRLRVFGLLRRVNNSLRYVPS